MKIIPFPTGGEGADPELIAGLEAALAGATAPGADAWRELSSDIRALAPAIDPGFERALRERLGPVTAPEAERHRRPAHVRRRGLARRPRALVLGGAGALAALVIALVTVGAFTSESPDRAITLGRAPQPGSGATRNGPARAQAAPQLKSDEAPAVGPAVSAPANSTSAGRVQQLGASLTLAGTPGEVQALAAGVSRIVNSEGGYVTSSQVQVETAAPSSATLQASVPSGHLTRTLAALGRLGAIRAESQSLQDITDAYEAAKRALGDALAERSALLRALAAASTQGQIESLHRRLAIAGGAIEQARSAFGAIAGEAANSTIEVTVLGDAKAAGQGLTLSRGLHDAGRVLTVALAVLLIGLAALIPLFAVGLAMGLVLRAVRRSARERALGGR